MQNEEKPSPSGEKKPWELSVQGQYQTLKQIRIALIEATRRKTDIVDVLSSYGIALTKDPDTGFLEAPCPLQGQRYKGKFPTFRVSPEKQVYFCDECEKGGDVFNFIRDYHNMTRDEAILFLARRAKIPEEQVERYCNALELEKGAEGSPLEPILDWEDVVNRTDKGWEVMFMRRLLYTAFVYDPKVVDYVSKIEGGRILNPQLRAVFNVVQREAANPDMRAAIRTDLYGERAMLSFLGKINAEIQDEKQKLSASTLRALLTPDPVCQRPTIRDLEMPLTAIRYYRTARKFESLNPENREINLQRLEALLEEIEPKIDRLKR